MKKLSILATTCYVLCSHSYAITNLQDGQLNNYTKARIYNINQVSNNAYATICAGVEQNSSQCMQNLSNLQKTYGFNIKNILNNPLGIKSIAAYNITYNTNNYIPDGKFNYQTRNVSGTVYIPENISADKIKGIILYYHPTMYNYNDYSPEQNLITGATYPAMYASQGYIVLLADLPGFGVDKTEMHPYIFPEISVTAGINMLKATKQLLDKLEIKRSDKYPLILNGFSEGGMLAQKASYMIQNNKTSLDNTNTKLTLTVPMSGAFDIKGKQLELEYANLTAPQDNKYMIQNQYVAALAKPGLVAYAVNSYNYYTNTRCSDILIESFCNFSYSKTPAKSIADIFESSEILDTMSTQDILYSLAQQVSKYSESNNSLDNILKQNLPQGYSNAFYNVTLTNWQTTTPITYIHLKRDSLLTPYNSIITAENVQKLSSKGLINRLEINNDNYFEYNHINIDHNNPIMYAVALSVFDKYSSSN